MGREKRKGLVAWQSGLLKASPGCLHINEQPVFSSRVGAPTHTALPSGCPSLGAQSDFPLLGKLESSATHAGQLPQECTQPPQGNLTGQCRENRAVNASVTSGTHQWTWVHKQEAAPDPVLFGQALKASHSHWSPEGRSFHAVSGEKPLNTHQQKWVHACVQERGRNPLLEN